MAERRAQQKYYPPDFDPESHGSLNRYVKSKKRLQARLPNSSVNNEDVLLEHMQGRLHNERRPRGSHGVRFEMPWNMWCGGCGRHIARSVRFNAWKMIVGKYDPCSKNMAAKPEDEKQDNFDLEEDLVDDFIPILEFGMQCPSCPQQIRIRTDPGTAQYLVVSGGKRKTEPLTSQELEGTDENKKSSNPFALAERERAIEASTQQEVLPALSTLKGSQNALFSADWVGNKRARDLLRQAPSDSDPRGIRSRLNLSEELVLEPERPEDIFLAKQVMLHTKTIKQSKTTSSPMQSNNNMKLPPSLHNHLLERAPHLLQQKKTKPPNQ